MGTLLRAATAALCLLLMPLAVPGRVTPGPSTSATPASVSSTSRPAARPVTWEGSAAAGGGFQRPLTGVPRPVRWFDPPAQPWLPGHRGVDLAAAVGAEVRSAGAGVVLFAGMVAGRPVVTVGHAGGLRTTYEPVRPGLVSGTRVTAGTPIGRLLAGHPGCPATACLHWGLRRGEEYLDPLALLGLGPVRLLPIGGVSDADPHRSGVAPGIVAAQRWASRAGSRTASRSYSSGAL